MAVIIVFAVLAVLAFGLRVYSRRLHRAVLDASDYTCLLGLVGVSYVAAKALGQNADGLFQVLDMGLVVILWGGTPPQALEPFPSFFLPSYW